ncbi:hypothetical protein BGX30_007845, partial [Mortierella sp. GBA39]
DVVRGRGQSEVLSDEVLASSVVHDQTDDKIAKIIENHDCISKNFNIIGADPQQPEI